MAQVASPHVLRRTPTYRLHGHNAGMQTAEERRKAKLEELCGTYGVDVVARCGNASAEYIKQILAGTLGPRRQDGSRVPRHVGTEMARAIEAGFGLERGWMDNDTVADGASGSPALARWRRVAARIAAHCEETGVTVPPAAFLVLVDAALDLISDDSTDAEVAAVFRRLWPLFRQGQRAASAG